MDICPVNAYEEDDSDDWPSDFEHAPGVEDTEEHELNWLKMLESHSESQANLKRNGTYS